MKKRLYFPNESVTLLMPGINLEYYRTMDEGVVRLINFTKTGHSRKIAKAVAQELQIQAEHIKLAWPIWIMPSPI